MLRRKSISLCLTAVTFCFGVVESAKAASFQLDYFVTDCYLDNNGDMWMLWWDCLDGTAQWEIVASADRSPHGAPAEASKGGDALQSTSMATNGATWSMSPFFNMVEESCKKSTYCAVFEPDGRIRKAPPIETVPLPE